MATEQLTAVFARAADGWIATVEEIPGVNSAGATLDEARENLREALLLVLAANREIARADPLGAPGVQRVRAPLVLLVPAYH